MIEMHCTLCKNNIIVCGPGKPDVVAPTIDVKTAGSDLETMMLF